MFRDSQGLSLKEQGAVVTTAEAQVMSTDKAEATDKVESTDQNQAPVLVEAAKTVTVEDICALSPFAAQVFERLGFASLTPVQQASLPLSLQGQNLVIQARTGSGKTLGYALPLLAHIASVSFLERTVALIVAPTRELAQQIGDVIAKIQDMFVPVVVIGGARIRDQLDSVAQDARVVVGTPGRLLDLIRRREISMSDCRFFVLDEADEMLSMGFFEEVEQILKGIPKGSHGIFTSATLTDRVLMLADKYLPRHEKVVVTEADDGVESTGEILHYYVKIGSDLLGKADAVERLMAKFKPRSLIVFCNTKSDTDFVEAVLTKRGVSLRKMNSDLTQSMREQVLQELRNGDVQVLVATDLAARGLDIDTIDLVIHYALPDNSEVYTHRSGRTGRAGRAGTSVSIIGPGDLLTLFQMRKSSTIPFQELVW